ncbi:AfsR/SARP family transcriptional regulator [Phytohabitans suffuscus]|uniref:SARP family transcriptional regulator n=1 Tax=Phytohabitans suffuscus TaxID=624315 RepID=A0A6F8YHM9_9ACTN|nr:BTAD domain-containing putative transcriptional regulator [Phytohabitans suffuscus]BCB85590.1 SARP family transcriptional regulator [Phytohabitans suffuscus]
MRFGILGPLRVGGAEDATVTAGRDRVVLAMLLLNAGRVVPVDRLVDAMWDGTPPNTARGQLQTCVSRLRRSLAATLGDEVIVTDPAGYSVRIAPDDLDATVFSQLTVEARAATEGDRLEKARAGYRAALELWRGPALSGIASRSVQRGAAALDEQQAVAIEECVEVELRLGRERELLGELTDLVELYPLRERLRAQLMLALYRAGRQADALAVYREARAVLADELGIEPGPALREMHQRILVGDVGALADERRPHPPARCLPRTAADFTGRGEVVARLVEAVERADPGGPVIQLIDGMAGSGKTTLAVHVATLLSGRYPDAQLFVDLHGHSERRPLEPTAALVTLLRQLGVPSERIPPSPDERVALWRTELAARRVLVVLDNAASTAQVGPLLPAAPGCLALVTSRRRLVGLDGVHPEPLPVLAEPEAVELLGRVAGPERITAEPAAAVEVVRRCGYLPLAIRLAGARLAHRRSWRVADLAARLRRERPVLPELAAEDRTVASAFALSYRQLPEPSQRLFRLLGLYPGAWFDALGAAAIADLPLAEAQDQLDELVDRHLVEEPGAGRFRLHDLMREYASELATATEPEAARQAAVGRVLDWALHAVAGATSELERGQLHGSLNLRRPMRPDLVVRFADDGSAWLEEQRLNLPALVRCAADTGHHEYAWKLARAMWRFLFIRYYGDDLLATQLDGLAAAQRSGDDAAVATMHNYLASVYFRAGEYLDAIEHVEAALKLRERLGHERDAAICRGNLGVVMIQLGRVAEAVECSLQALTTWRRLANEQGISSTLADLGMAYMLLGRYDESLRMHRRHLLLGVELGLDLQVGFAIGHIAQVRLRLGQARVAIRLLRSALHLKRRTGNRYGEGEVLNDLGVGHRLCGERATAERYHRDALRIMREIGDRRGEALVRNDLGITLAGAGRSAEASEHHTQALAIARQIKHRYEEARALDGLASGLRDTDPAQARRYWERCLSIRREMGIPEAATIARRLAELDAEQAATAGR